MSLKSLETHLSVQGQLSGTASSTDVKKFAANELASVNKKLHLAPIVRPHSTKSSAIFTRAVDSRSIKRTVAKPATATVTSNAEHAISHEMPEPLAIYTFTDQDTQSLVAAAYKAYFEDKCSLEFSKGLINLVQQKDSKVLAEMKTKLTQEVSAVDAQLSSMESFMSTCEDLNKTFNTLSPSSVKSVFDEKYSLMFPDPLGLDGRGDGDFSSFMQYIGYSKSEIENKRNTTILTQLLALASNHLLVGASSAALGRKRLLSIDPADGPLDVDDAGYSSKSFTNLSSISLRQKENSSFLYGVSETEPYTSKIRFDLIKYSDNLQKAAYAMTLVANEMAISTGIARLQGTQLGKTFGADIDYQKYFFGTQGIATADSETSVRGSLVDYFVVNEDGGNDVGKGAGVLLFDGTSFSPSGTRSNSFDAFVVSTIRSPISKTANKSDKFEAALAAADSNFDTGIKFFNTLTSRSKDAKLLTPRGLFTRLLTEFAKSIAPMRSHDIENEISLNTLCLLSVLGKLPSQDKTVSVIKGSLLTLMAKKVQQLQSPSSTASATSKTGGEKKPNVVKTTTRVTTTDESGQSKTTTVSSESSQDSAGSAGSVYTWNPRLPRLCEDEERLFYSAFDTKQTQDLFNQFMSLPVASRTNDPDYKTTAFSVNELYKSISENYDNFLDSLVKIYIDLCEESILLCNEVNYSASPVDATRLTKNSKTDGALLLAMILESAILLSTEFIEATLVADGLNIINFYQQQPESERIISNNDEFPHFIQVRVGQDSQVAIAAAALGAISAASANDSFDTLFLPENGDLTVPAIGSYPQNTVISHDKNSSVTVATAVDTFRDLVFEKEMPALCIAHTAAIVSYLHTNAKKYTEIASQMIGASPPQAIAKSIIDLAKSSVGSKFISSVNAFSLDTARKRIEDVKAELSSDSGRLPKLTLGEMRCVKIVLESISTNASTNIFTVVGLPKDYVTKSISGDYSLMLDRLNNVDDTLMKVTCTKRDVFSGWSSAVSNEMLIRSPFNSASFSVFETSPPAGMQDILDRVIVDGNVSGGKYVDGKLDTGRAHTVLYNEVVSYLLKKLFSVLSSADLFAQNIVDSEIFTVDNKSASTAKYFATAYGLVAGTFDTAFFTNSDGKTIVDEESLLRLTLTDYVSSKFSTNLSHPTLTFGEAELFYDLFMTVHFQLGCIQQRVFSSSLLDETVGFFSNSSSFPQMKSDPQTITVNGPKQVSGISTDMEYQSKFRQSPTFDTYSLEATIAAPLVNK